MDAEPDYSRVRLDDVVEVRNRRPGPRNETLTLRVESCSPRLLRLARRDASGDIGPSAGVLAGRASNHSVLLLLVVRYRRKHATAAFTATHTLDGCTALALAAQGAPWRVTPRSVIVSQSGGTTFNVAGSATSA